MKRKTFLTTFILTISLICIAMPVTLMAGETIQIKAATYHPLKHRLTDDCFKLWGKEVEKRTGGKVKFKWYLANSLVAPPQTYSAVKSGVVDMSVPALLWIEKSRFPISNGIELPFLMDSPSHATRTLQLMYQNIPEMRKEYAAAGVVPLGFGTADINTFHFKKDPVKKLEDFKGRKIITPAAGIARTLKELGATPVVIKTTDIYTALQRGMADALAYPFAPMRSQKHTDFLSAHTDVGFAVSPHTFIMNKKKWDKLPQDVKKVFEDLSTSLACLNAKTLENESAWVTQALKDRGDQVVTLSPEERQRIMDKLSPIYDEWVKGINKKGMDGRAILNKMIKLAAEARKSPCQRDSWWGRAGKK